MTTTTGNVSNGIGAGWGSSPKDKIINGNGDKEPTRAGFKKKPIKGSANREKVLIVGHRERFLEGLDKFLMQNLGSEILNENPALIAGAVSSVLSGGSSANESPVNTSEIESLSKKAEQIENNLSNRQGELSSLQTEKQKEIDAAKSNLEKTKAELNKKTIETISKADAAGGSGSESKSGSGAAKIAGGAAAAGAVAGAAAGAAAAKQAAGEKQASLLDDPEIVKWLGLP